MNEQYEKKMAGFDFRITNVLIFFLNFISVDESLVYNVTIKTRDYCRVKLPKIFQLRNLQLFKLENFCFKQCRNIFIKYHGSFGHALLGSDQDCEYFAHSHHQQLYAHYHKNTTFIKFYMQ